VDRLEGFPQGLVWRKNGEMNVGRLDECPQEESQIRSLGESRKLGHIVLADIENPLDAILLEHREELRGGLLGVADGEDFYRNPRC
jgi:hypothetical protein